jgi:hypothetical protein
MAQVVGLPSWAVKDAEVWLELGTYGRERRFRKAKITRTSSTSVWVKRVSADGTLGTTEYRFSRTETYYRGYNAADRAKPQAYYMVEYGNRGSLSYSPSNTLHALDAADIKEAQEEGRRDDIRRQAEIAAKSFTEDYRAEETKLERARKAVARLEAFIAEEESRGQA